MQYMGEAAPYGSEPVISEFIRILYKDSQGNLLPLEKGMQVLAVHNVEMKHTLEKILDSMKNGKTVHPATIDNLVEKHRGLFEAFAQAYQGMPYRKKYPVQFENIKKVWDDFTAMQSTLTQYDIKTSRPELQKKIETATIKYKDVPKLKITSSLLQSGASTGSAGGDGSGSDVVDQGENIPLPEPKKNTGMKIAAAAAAGLIAFMALKG